MTIHSKDFNDVLKPCIGIFDDALVEALRGFLQAADRICTFYEEGHFTLEPGDKFIKFWTGSRYDQGVGSANGFIAIVGGSNKKLGTWKRGDVFMAESTKQPARVVRGNIFEPESFENMLGRQGVRYVSDMPKKYVSKEA